MLPDESQHSSKTILARCIQRSRSSGKQIAYSITIENTFMPRLKSSDDVGRQGTKSVVVDCDDEKLNRADQPVVKQNVGASDTDKRPLDDLLILIAKLAAKRWYRCQAEQHASPQVHSPTKEPSCEKENATPNASVSLPTSLTIKPKARRKK